MYSCSGADLMDDYRIAPNFEVRGLAFSSITIFLNQGYICKNHGNYVA